MGRTFDWLVCDGVERGCQLYRHGFEHHLEGCPVRRAAASVSESEHRPNRAAFTGGMVQGRTPRPWLPERPGAPRRPASRPSHQNTPTFTLRASQSPVAIVVPWTPELMAPEVLARAMFEGGYWRALGHALTDRTKTHLRWVNGTSTSNWFEQE